MMYIRRINKSATVANINRGDRIYNVRADRTRYAFKLIPYYGPAVHRIVARLIARERASVRIARLVKTRK